MRYAPQPPAFDGGHPDGAPQAESRSRVFPAGRAPFFLAGVLLAFCWAGVRPAAADEVRHYVPWSEKPGEAHGLPREFATWTETIEIDSGVPARSIEADLLWARAADAPQAVAVAVIDAAEGDACELRALHGVPEDDWPTLLERPIARGYGHLLQPVLCLLPVPNPAAGRLKFQVDVQRSAPTAIEGTHSSYWPAAPLQQPARAYALILRVDATLQGRFTGVRRPKVRSLPSDRREWRIDLENVEGLPLDAPLDTVVGVVAGLSLHSPASPRDLGRTLHEVWSQRTQARGPAMALAAQVLVQPDAKTAVRKALDLSFAAVALEGRGSILQNPALPEESLERGSGSAVDRAALIVALLRAADLRASVIFAEEDSRADVLRHPFGPSWRPFVAVADLPGIGGGPLLLDPSTPHPALALVAPARPERKWRALSWGPYGTRSIALPSIAPRRTWTLSVHERMDGLFDVVIDGEWAGGVETFGDAPDSALATAALGPLGPWLSTLRLQPTLESSGPHVVHFHAVAMADRATVLPGEALPAPAVPLPPLPTVLAPGFPADTRAEDLRWTEEWTFRGAPPTKVTGQGEVLLPGLEATLSTHVAGAVIRRSGTVRIEGGLLAAPVRERAEDVVRLYEAR